MAYLDGCSEVLQTMAVRLNETALQGCCVMNQCEDKTKERSTHEY